MKKPTKYFDNEHWRYSLLMWDRAMLDDDQFGAELPYWCEDCGPIRNLSYQMTSGGTWESPEEGDYCCDQCGSPYTGEMDDHQAFRLVRRYRVRL